MQSVQCNQPKTHLFRRLKLRLKIELDFNRLVNGGFWLSLKLQLGKSAQNGAKFKHSGQYYSPWITKVFCLFLYGCVAYFGDL